jgi:tetratricopeptide (TPR) repeat protein
MDRLRGRSSAVLGTLLGSVVFSALSFAPVGAENPAPGPAAASAADALKAADMKAVEAARRKVADGQLAAAVTALADYVAANPKEVAPATYLGDLYYRSANLSAAESTYLAILNYAPDARDVHDRLGGMYAAMDRTKDAVAQFTLSLPLSSAYGHLVELHRRIGDLRAFEQGYRDAVQDAPSDPAALFALGAVYNAERRSREAISLLERAQALAGSSPAILSQLGNAYLDLGDDQRASVVIKQCLAIDRNDYACLVDLSDADLGTPGHDDDAAVLLDRAVAERPDRPEAYIDLGYIEDDGGRSQNAIALYLKAISLDPFERDAYVDLGFDYMTARLFGLAEAAILKGLSVSPGDGRLHYVLGLTYMQQGKRDLARAESPRAAGGDEPEIVRAATEVLSQT